MYDTLHVHTEGDSAMLVNNELTASAAVSTSVAPSSSEYRRLTFKREVELRAVNKVPTSPEGWDRFKFQFRTELALIHLLGVIEKEGDTHTPDELRVVAGNLISRLSSNGQILDRVRTLPNHIVEGTGEDIGVPHPFHIWKVISDEFQKITTPHMYRLMADLRGVHMNKSFLDFRSKIELLVGKLATMGYRVPEEEKVCTLLTGLPDDPETSLVANNIEYRHLSFEAACAELEMHFNRKEGWEKVKE